MIKAVVFDIDDTLYDYHFCNDEASKVLYRKVGDIYSLSETIVQETYARANCLVKSRLGNVAASHNRLLYIQNLCELLGKNSVCDAIDLYELFWGTFLNHMVKFDYVEDVFVFLRERQIKIGILTDLTAHIQHRKLKKLGIAEYVDALVTSEEAGEEKPGKRMFDLISEKLGVAPNETIMVGDSYKKDIQGAKDAGMYYLWVAKEARMLEQTPYNNVLQELKRMIEGRRDEF